MDLDAALRSFSTSTLDDRHAVLEALVERWFGATRADLAVAAATPRARAIPKTLDWMTSLGRRTDIFRQNHFLEPLDDEGKRLIILRENQGCWDLAVPYEDGDPTVWVRVQPQGVWVSTNVPTSVALFHLLALEIALAAPSAAWTACASDEIAGWLGGHLPEIQVPGFELDCTLVWRVFATADAIAVTMFQGGAWIGAKSAESLQFLAERERDWEWRDP